MNRELQELHIRAKKLNEFIKRYPKWHPIYKKIVAEKQILDSKINEIRLNKSASNAR